MNDSNVSVCIRSSAGTSPDRRTLARRAGKMLKALGRPDDELSILICSDREIKRLNHQYRKRPRATNVLSFGQLATNKKLPDAPVIIGDVVISAQTADRESRRMSISLLKHVTWLLAHGILHLYGHRHESEADENIMQKKTLDLAKKACEPVRRKG